MLRHTCLGLAISVAASSPAWANDALKPAIDKGIKRIEQGAANYPKQRSCFSCHHQAMSIMAMQSAQERGFKVNGDLLKQSVQFSLKTFTKKDQLIKGQGVGGANTTVAYALLTLASVDYPADDTTGNLVQFLLARQRKDGAWPATANRPPSEGSVFTTAALALLALQKYGADKSLDDDLRKEVKKAMAKSADWLAKNQPKTHEDRVFHLRGLVYAKADAKQIDAARKALIEAQRPDGSWSQLADLTGDSYATGSALIALRSAGMHVKDAVYEKGTAYLLDTQKEDGSWFVKTRSRPIQTFFDNGDPGDKSQFISFAATNWALLALLENVPVVKKK
jgi:squalene cyclase